MEYEAWILRWIHDPSHPRSLCKVHARIAMPTVADTPANIYRFHL